MTLTRLKAVLSKKPFEPFSLHLADGRDFEVRHPEMVKFYGNERSFAVYQNGRIHVTDSILVIDIEFAEEAEPDLSFAE